MSDGAVVVVGGTRAIGLEIVKHYAAAGRDVVLTGRDQTNIDNAVSVARGIAEGTGRSGTIRGIRFDLSEPETIAEALAEVGPVRYLVLVAIDRDQNTIRDYDTTRATRLSVLKLVGYAEVVHALLDRLDDSSSIVLFGGQARFVPYPGSTTVTTVNGGIEGLTRSLVYELKPIRVNCIHPGIVGDSPYWENRGAALDATRARTPTGRLASMAEIVAATAFLLESPAINGVELRVDGGLHAT
jgi:NAD(P)-dependent dehydrogenase (short-subunit alcohol dehydrogenase family)